jgi:hypothetical protein
MTRYFTKCSQDGVECATALPLMKLPHLSTLTSLFITRPEFARVKSPSIYGQ